MAFERNRPAIQADTGGAFGAALDITPFVDSLSLNQAIDELMATTFNDDNKVRMPGLPDYTVSFTAFQDFAASSFNSKMQQIVGKVVGWKIQAKKPLGTPTATNPAWTFNGFLSNYSPLEGTVEELAKSSCTVAVSGAVSYLTS